VSRNPKVMFHDSCFMISQAHRAPSKLNSGKFTFIRRFKLH